MKLPQLLKRLTAALLCAAVLSGCAVRENGQALPEAAGEPLQLFTSQKETVVTPLLQEFESRTGVWVEVTYGSLWELSETEGADVVLGAGNFAAWEGLFAPRTEDGPLWEPVYSQPAVLILNDKLVPNREAPAEFSDLAEERFAGAVALCSPASSETAAAVLSLLAETAGEETARSVLKNLQNDAFSSDEDAAASVADGTCLVGIVPEGVALRAIQAGEDLRCIYPEQTVTVTVCGAVRKAAAHKDEARALLSFLLLRDTQAYLSGTLFCRPVSGALPDTLPELPAGREMSGTAWETADALWQSAFGEAVGK